jgi:ribosomal-protein-alanine N-acetyltransferase
MSAIRVIPAHGEMAAVLAQLHALCFELLPETPWPEGALRSLLKAPGHMGFVAVGPGEEPTGFLLGRETGGDAELLTICVRPDSRRCGVARQLLAAFADALPAQTRIVLEVAVGNRAAIELYQSMRFVPVGRRPGYYGSGAEAQDALIYACEHRSE